MIALQAAGIRAGFDPDCGFIRGLTVTDQGRAVAPLHRAPWVGLETFGPEHPPHLTGMEGDFFCAPFAQEGADGAPFHGWPANAVWQVTASDGATLTATLPQKVNGATLTKVLCLMDGHPFLYQAHTFTGGQGALPVANHAMVSLPQGGLIAMSPKRWFQTPLTPPESDPAEGRHTLTYPARATDPRLFPGADLTRYPFGPSHEDFVMAVEQTPGLGWTAVTRPAEGDLYLSLRDSGQLPMTMLWHSNAGRDYAPWSGRHRFCLGVEEGACATMLPPEARGDLGGPGLVTLGGTFTVRHVIGAIAWPSGQRVTQVTRVADGLHITGEGGAERTVPYDAGFLAV